MHTPFLQHRLCPYLRVSSKDQRHASQEVALRRWFKHKGYEWPPDEFVFREKASAFAGDGYTKRVELQRAIRHIEASEIAGLVVLRPNRYFRNTRTALSVYDRLFKSGAKLIMAERDYDALTQENYPRFLQEIAEAEKWSLDAGQRIREGKTAKFERGEYGAGRTARGLRRRDGELVWTKAALPVRQAIKLIAAGEMSLAEVAAAVSTPEETFTQGQVRKWVVNPIYYGYVRHVKRAFGKNNIKATDLNAAPLKRGSHKPLVSPKLYKQVRAILKQRANAGRGGHTTRTYWIPHGVCAQCGGKLSGRKRVGRQGAHKAYLCADYYYTRQCSAGCATVGEAKIGRQIAALVGRIRPSKEWLDASLDLLKSRRSDESARAINRTDAARIRERLARQYAARKITLDQFMLGVADLDKREAESVARPVASRARELEDAAQLLDNLLPMWSAATDRKKRILLDRVFSSMTVDTQAKRLVSVVAFDWTAEAMRASGFTASPDNPNRFDIPDDAPQATRALVVRHLVETGPATARQVAEALNITLPAARAALRREEADGRLKSEKVGIDKRYEPM